ncbi:hypothetical protein DH86_00003677 [Scytalidium sp. 3C]|nr:hypothetical protein DH86_00003677 [Scytalidium sp. 3C]
MSLYRNKNSSDADFELVNSMYKRIMSEDKYLCDLTQKNLNAGVFVNGELHPRMEKGPLYFQKVVRDLLTEHYRREQEAKQEIWPARQVLPRSNSVTQNDVSFCSNLSCQAGSECGTNAVGQPIEGIVW